MKTNPTRALKKKYDSMSIQAKAAAWFVFCSFLQKGISFITVPIFTRLLSTEEYGTYSLYISWLQILTIITTLNLSYGVLDNAMSKFDSDRSRYISAMQGLTITITTIVFAVYLCAMGFWESVLRLSRPFVLLMFFEVYLVPGLSFWSGREKFEYHYKKLVFVTLAKSITNPVLGIIFVYWKVFSDKAFGRIISSVIIDLIVCGSIIVFQFIKGKTFYIKKYWKYGLSLALPMIPHYLSGTILNQGDRIVIERLIDKSTVAYYSVAYSIGMLVQIFTHAVNSATTPWFYNKFKNKDISDISKTVSGLLLFVAGICICIMTLSPELVSIFGSAEYEAGAYVVPPVAASVYYIFMYYIFSLPEFYFEKTSFMFVASLVAAIVNIGLNFLFVRWFGFVAAGYTTLVCYVLYGVGHYIIGNRILKASIGTSKIYDMKVVTGISVLLIAYTICISFFFDYCLIRYGILMVGVLIAIVKRKTIVSLLVRNKN